MAKGIADAWADAASNPTLAKDGRPFFICWADDAWSAPAIRQWAQEAMAKLMRDSISNGVAPKEADLKAVMAAFALAITIETWQHKNPTLTGPNAGPQT